MLISPQLLHFRLPQGEDCFPSAFVNLVHARNVTQLLSQIIYSLPLSPSFRNSAARWFVVC